MPRAIKATEREATRELQCTRNPLFSPDGFLVPAKPTAKLADNESTAPIIAGRFHRQAGLLAVASTLVIIRRSTRDLIG